MSTARQIEHRIEQHSKQKPLTALERSRKLKSLQVTLGKLTQWRKSCRDIINRATTDLQECNKQLEKVTNEIELLSQSHEPVVTEHALLRYLERHYKLDLESCHAEILKLDESKLVRSGNTIITVYSDDNDHYNLAEKEK